MAMNLDSEVIPKKTNKQKGNKAEGNTEDVTIQFNFRASTLATLAVGRVAEEKREDTRRRN